MSELTNGAIKNGTNGTAVKKELLHDLEDYQERVGKIDLAHRAGIMADLLSLLGMERRNSQQAETYLLTGKLPESSNVADTDVGDVLIDSPTTHNHNYPSLPAKSSVVPWMVSAAVLAGGIGAAGYMMRPVPPTNTSITEGFKLEFVTPKDGQEKKP